MHKHKNILRAPYRMREKYKKKYGYIKDFLLTEINFSKKNDSKILKQTMISEKKYTSRVWLLFASNDNRNWECLQVAHSKNNVQKEVEEVIDLLLCQHKYNLKNVSYTNSAFYEAVCPNVKKEFYRKFLYSCIGSKYEYFRIGFLNVDKYLGTKTDSNTSNTDCDRIIQICKHQYAEAKVAYQTLAIYWRQYPSGIDGQTIAYIAEHPSEFE